MLLRSRAQKNQAGNELHFRGTVFWLAGWVMLMALGWDAGQCRGQESRPDVEPPAPWVVPIPFDPRARLDAVDPSQEMRWILIDRQINAQNNETFNHEVRQVLTPSGIDTASRISIDYDPSYQLLTFHWVRILRETKSLDRLDLDKIQASQRAPEAEELLFNTEKTAILLLEDVRAGDIIDYAYSLQGDNPVFAGRFSDRVELQSSHPIERLTTRLLWPSARRLYIQNHGTNIKYAALRSGGQIEFTWNLAKAPAWQSEPSLPAWYHPFPWVQLSEFQSWSDVNQLVLDLFTNTSPFSAELTRQINEWKSLPVRQDRALAALRFVQDEVRNLGVESGDSGYKPTAPSAVFDRRFGDCKDKSFLLVAILRALGFEAWPTLVNTRIRQGVAELHPSATAFDHAITEVKVDGLIYWLDSTASYQRGPLGVRSWPNYGYGLVVRPGATALTAIAPSAVLPRTTVTQYIRLGVQDQASELKVVTVAEGSDAERLREEYATTTRDEIEQSNLNYYAKFYPEIEKTAPMTYADDEQQNQIEVDEFYSVRKIWKQLPNEIFLRCWIYPANIETILQPPAISTRTMPMALAYPVDQIFRAIVVVPSLAVIKQDDQAIDNPSFFFHRAVAIADGKLSLEYEYRSQAGAVQPEAFPNYVRQVDSAAELMDYAITSY
jgi:transglutaminase-like putative cysteine protease